MDFKTELQNLVNRYPGMIKKVKVEFVEEMAVEPNGTPPTVYNPIPAQSVMPAPVRPTPKPRTDLFQLDETVKPFPGQTIDGARPMPEKKSLDPETEKALKATLAVLNNPPSP